MKKIFLLFSGFIAYTQSFAQEPADALRYSWYVPSGSARTQAIGGAMGSLGGDITANFVNPAGLAFYKTGDFIFTPMYQFQKTKGSYLSRTEQDRTNRFTWGTTGFVFGMGDNKNRNVRNMALSIAINRTADFNGDILYRGQNNQSSFSQKFVEELNNSGVRDSISAENDFPQGSSLAYNTHWIDAVKNSSGQVDHFVTNAPIATGLNQQQTIKSRGGITEFAIGMAVNLKDKLMIGGSFGIPVLNYTRETEFVESDATSNPSNRFDYGVFSDKLHTYGAGLNFRAGLIYKPAEFWRLGLAVQTPTLFSLTDTYEANVVLNDDVASDSAWHDNSKNYNNGQASEFKYLLVTPYRVTGSISYVIREIQDITKQRGFLTADVEYVNYKASSFSTDNSNGDATNADYLKSLNHAIDKAYKGAFNFRVGGELKFTTWMFRLGAAYYSNPYKDIRGENGNKLNLSGGLGYRNKGFFIDLTYVQALNKDVNFAYRLENDPYYAANIKNNTGNVLATVGFKF
ncbi:MAG: OmpP1/FadL family transporter [Flavisolibacter sp.]